MRLPRFPDLLTTANLCCGTASILLASQGQLTIACWLVFAAAIFDVFDGLAARAMGGGTPLGAQLDSLADMVSFGVAPAFALWTIFPWTDGHGPIAVALAAILLCAASAWRLAKFNVDTRQTHGFLGLPTPANGLFWVSALLASSAEAIPHSNFAHDARNTFASVFMHPNVVLAVAVLLSVLMLSELPLPGLKFKHGGWKGNEVIFLLIGIGVVLVLLYGILAVPLLLVLYILSPIWGKLFPKTT
ncbi:MAG: CDP-diacylglycerol--serine O-phosphatidyltransferase [Flavobacteriales bacterium]|jgi:CDP-diacylglycerol--serine O-phosphatidyltransferase|nr:CDP-diacylglycerol--serine O-phosphatidyltransferase [Flavobacteriales bacterium]